MVAFLGKQVFCALVEQVELYAILYGLQLVMSYGCESIVVESNSRIFVRSIAKGDFNAHNPRF